MNNPYNIAIVGCGNISDIYIHNLSTVFENTFVYALCDSDTKRAYEKAKKHNISKVLTFEEILKDENVDIILNLTPPFAHYDICKAAINANKNVYTEKPLADTYEKGEELCRQAQQKGVYIGCAPDTFMGAAISTCKKLIEEGALGKIIGFNAFMMDIGPEAWHPNAEIFYQKGAGPMLDRGPYYIAALYHLLGPIEETLSMSSCVNESRFGVGNPFISETPTYISGLIKLKSGAVGHITATFDACDSSMQKIEIYGTEGTLIVPDPNFFDGKVMLKPKGEVDFKEIPLCNNLTDNLRGIGLQDMVACLMAGNPEKALTNGNTALQIHKVLCEIK